MDTFEGKLTLDGEIYNFSYINKYITIFPNSIENDWQKYSGLFFTDKKKNITEKMLNGTLRVGNSITFIDVNLYSYGRGYLKGYVPLYIISKANSYINMPPAGNFYNMSFSGECVNNIFSPSKIIKESSFDSKKLQPKLEFYSINDIKKTKKLNDDNLNLFIGINYKDKKQGFPIKLYSELVIDFNKEKEIEDIKAYFLNIYKTFCFLFNRNSILFNEVILSRKIKVISKEMKNGAFVDVENEEIITYNLILNDEIESTDIKELNIDIDTFFDTFENLYNIINEKMFSLNYYPKNNYENTHLDSFQFIKIASAFEGQFDNLFPNFKSTNKNQFKEVKESLIDEINKKINVETLIGKQKKYYETFKDMIEKFEGPLSEQINYAMNIFNKSIQNSKQRLFFDFDIKNKTNDDISVAFQKKRNLLVHSLFNESFTNLEIVGYDLIKILVHCLILKRANYDDENIAKIINIIF